MDFKTILLLSVMIKYWISYILTIVIILIATIIEIPIEDFRNPVIKSGITPIEVSITIDKNNIIRNKKFLLLL